MKRKSHPIKRRVFFSLIMLALATLFIACSNPDKKLVSNLAEPTRETLKLYSRQTPFTEPAEFVYLYYGLPESVDEVNNLIKKQLIHPLEAREMKDILPKGRFIEDGDFPTISDVLEELMARDSEGLTSDRKPKDRLVIACYHHALLLASILRDRHIPVRLRAGFARYFEKQANIRFGHVICEVWDEREQKWIWVDPDRNYTYMTSDQFELPAETWQNYRNDDLDGVTYNSSLTQGTQAFIHILLLDHAFTFCNERNYWHTPEFLFTDDFSIKELEADQIKLFDRIALLLDQPENQLEELQQIYDENEFIHARERSIDTYYEKMTGESLEDLDE